MNDDIDLTSAYDRLEKIRERLKPDRTSVSNKEDELLSLAMKMEHGTPYFKINHFVGDAQITAYAKYKQFLLELRGKEEMIEQTLVTIAKNELDIELYRMQASEAKTPFDIKRAEFNLVAAQNDLVKTRRRLELVYEERDRFLKAIQEMYDTGAAYLPDGTDLKDAIYDPEMSQKLEAQHWIYRLGKQAALEIFSFGKIGTGNLDAISNLDADAQVQTFGIALDWSTRLTAAYNSIEASVKQELASKPTFNIELDGKDHMPRLDGKSEKITSIEAVNKLALE